MENTGGPKRPPVAPGGKNPFPVPAQGHHIFPMELWDSPLGKRLRKLGINLNNADDNGVLLPSQNYNGRTASIHRGPHNDKYIEALQDELNKIKGPWTKDKVLTALDNIRKRLQSGNLPLNGAE